MDKINYLVLLRGINVGGNNLIKMDDLKNIFVEMDLKNVKTYIQSGNILFMDHEKNKIKLKKKIEKALFEKINLKINVLILTFTEIKEILNNIPYKFGDDNKKYKYDIVFLIEPLSVKEVMEEIQTKKTKDQIYGGEKVLYIKRFIEKLTGSYLSKIMKTQMWQNITIRNLNTTKKLYELMLEREINIE